MKYDTLRPGLLVSLKTTVSGNVAYRKRDIEQDHVTETGERVAVWETERTITDPAEHDAAVKVRSRCRTIITAVCSGSSFGLLCPEANADKLDAAIVEAREVADAFNLAAKLTRVQVFVMAGRIAPDDVEAVRAIRSEVRDLVSDMERGVASLDVEKIRAAANKARELGAMLSPDAAERVKTAVETARKAARAIVKAAEQGAAEVDQAVLRKLADARTAFLDLTDEGEETAIEAPATEARAIDLDPEVEAPAELLTIGQVDQLLSKRDGNDHPTLCQCADCEALYGSVDAAINQPSPAVRSIELIDD